MILVRCLVKSLHANQPFVYVYCLYNKCLIVFLLSGLTETCTGIVTRGLGDLFITTYKLQTADSVFKNTVTKQFENVAKST